MRPTRPTDPSEEELIAQIKDSLMGHEEPYAIGAWERFSERERKPRGLLFWIGGLSSAAAVFLIAIGLYFYRGDQPERVVDPGSMHAKRGAEPAFPEPAVTENSASGRVSGEDSTPQQKVADLPSKMAKRAEMDVVSPAAVRTGNAPVVMQPERLAAAEPITKQETVSVQSTPDKKVQETDKPTFQEFLNRESLSAKQDKKTLPATDDPGKWEMGLMVAPSFGNTKKLNMGYGLSMGYALSNKVSLSSGVSYNELAASKDLSAAAAGMSAPVNPSIARETKSLSAVETSISGIDIPLEVRYHFNKSLYANVGVSAFAVISQTQRNSYVEQKLVERSAGFATDNKDVISTFVVAEKTTEDAPKSELSQDRYLGFYNFSFGYKQKVSGAKSISIEPFMKVPMKDVSRDNLKLIGTGVRLKFDF